MELPADTPPPTPPPVPETQAYSVFDAPLETVAANPDPYAQTAAETESRVNGPLPFAPAETSPVAETDEPQGSVYDEVHDGFGDEDGYYQPVSAHSPSPSGAGRFFKIAARVLLAAAVVAAIIFFVVPYVRQYFSNSNGKNTAGMNAPRANLPPPMFTPTPTSTSSPGTNVNGAPNANGSPQPSGSANNSNTASPTSTATPASTPALKPTPAPAPSDSGSGNFAIQVGSHPDANSANQQVAQLQAKGLSARTVQAAIPGRGTWYRVRIGHFASRDEATQYGASLRGKGVADFYVTDDGK